MRAMILAAGRGKRMGTLTDHVPKPLLRIGEHYLIEHIIASLVQAHIREIIINVAYRGNQIKEALGNGERYGVSIIYSEEKECLETGGGIFQALPLLGHQPFLVISSDIITDYPLERLHRMPSKLAHLVLVDNPPYHARGDFGLLGSHVDVQATPIFTFGNIGMYRPELFACHQPGYFQLADVLLPAIHNGQITGEHYRGTWYNIGTQKDLEEMNTAYVVAS
ncbi:MAG: mannose-1-phosphate guanylyltransferase [Gammaproteobacteria bacterium RIFCSPHIGHO2_12_FULL_37_34]|nr:MAG: mannose-1-phosphate guanylyltransferase [Gammaproteobacteria bacterium RIFCSPHIGHO2_12_FULL_37_34]